MQKFNEIYFRPNFLDEYFGQDKIKKALKLYIKSAKIRQDCLDHIIIYGNSGLGKTTLANIIANEMNSDLISISAPSIKTVQEMVDILMNLNKHSILFIDEIHRLPKKIEEVLYFAMEDFLIETDNDGIKERVEMSPFTLIGATTQVGMLSEPMRNRFQITLELIPYNIETLTEIVVASIEKMEGTISKECAKLIAKRSRGIPRIANGFVRRVRDFALVLNNGEINKDIINETFEFLDIDENGLTAQDRRYIEILYKKFGKKAVGIDTICSVLNDDKKTIETVVEPFLIQLGFVVKTPRGRIICNEAIQSIRKGDNK